MAASPGLFDHSLPHGFHYRENFITEAEERVLLDTIGHVAFSDFKMRGVVARRRVAFFGQSYDPGGGGAASSISVATARYGCAVG
jgi:predicted dienelactone hydrolase